MDSCSPIACCNTNNDDDELDKQDQCMCGFGYLNGGLPIAAVQSFLILGTFLSLASLGDCAFVKIDEDLRFDIGPTKDANTFGYLTFEDAFEGRCYWYDDGGATSQEQVKEYWDFVGHDFNLTRIFAMIGAGGGLLQLLYSMTLCCSSQVRRLRYLQFVLVSIILTIFQGSTLLIFSSDFCAEYTCTFGRSAGFSGASCACYFMAGAMYLTMSDYPGDDFDHSNGTTDAHSDSLPDQFMDEEGAGGPYEVIKPATPYPDSISGEDTTPPTSNTKNNATENVEAPNVLESPLPSVGDNASSTAPADDTTAPSVTSVYIEDGNSATPSNDGSGLGPPPTSDDPLAAAFTDTAPTESTPTETEVDVVEEEFVDETVETIEEEVVEEIIEEEVVEEYVEEELNGGLETVTEEVEPPENEAGTARPLSPVPSGQKESLGAPQAPPESPIGKEERVPQSAEEVADDASDDPIFEE